MNNDRKEYIGGSDIASVMNMSRWKTPLQLWAEKVGLIEPKDLSDNEAVELGTELEDFVAKKFERKTGMKVRRPPVTSYISKTEPWMRCQVDRLIVNEKDYHGVDALLEVKTCSMWKLKEWDGESIPQEYILQVLWQLMITKRQVGWIACLIGGQKFVYKEIKADEEMFQKMIAHATSFWQMVKDKTAPMACADDTEALLEIFPENKNEGIIQGIDELNNEIARRQELSMHIKEMETEKDEVENRLKQIVGDNLGLKTKDYILTWKAQLSKRVDNDKLKEDGLYEKYLKEIQSRVLRVAKNKEVEK